MNFEEALDVADEAVFLSAGRRLNEVEIALLHGSWQGQSYGEIANAAGYSISYLQRDVGPKLWRMLAQALGEAVSKTNFRPSLERRWRSANRAVAVVQDQQEPLLATSASSAVVPAIAQPMPANVPRSTHDRVDWGEVVDVSNFYGRATELTTLSQWIVNDRRRDLALGNAALLEIP